MSMITNKTQVLHEQEISASTAAQAPHHYLVYWRPKNVESRLARHPLLNNAGSSQFRYVNRGDVLWFVTVRKGKLFLVGTLAVGRTTDWKSAINILGEHVAEKSRFIVIAEPGTEEYMQDIPLEAVTEDIRFENSSNDRFNLVGGNLNPQQMQMKRRLTAASSQLISSKWGSGPTNFNLMKPKDLQS